jgi:4-hydroxy-2-oxoheptanedioate aldolase
VYVVMVVPGDLLGRADLQLGNAKAWTFRVIGATLYLVERARILHCLHRNSSIDGNIACGAVVRDNGNLEGFEYTSKGESMTDIARLNGVIRALESGKPVFTSFCQADPETAIAMATAKYDGIVFEMEHNPWDIRALRDSLQYMLHRGQIAKSASLAPAVTPMVRIPPNGSEKAQFHAKQALDLGVYGIVWPHISSVEEAYNAVAACRYPRRKALPDYEPAGIRGDGPTAAVRYWGLAQQDYYDRADVWPLSPKGEVFVILMMEDMRGIEALPEILKRVPGIGAILIGEGDLSQELGYPRQYEHPEVLKWMARVVNICKEHNVVVGHPHVDAHNVERILGEGYRFLMAAPVRSYAALEKGLKLAGR